MKSLMLDESLALSIADYYEYSMAHAISLEGLMGTEAVFELFLRRPPVNKVIGEFTHEGTTYDKLGRRNYLINAGLEQALYYLTECGGSDSLADYLRDVMRVDNEPFLSWVTNLKFSGDVYAMREGEVFFAREPQLRIHERFEIAQVFETILLNTINSQTNVATNAYDYRLACGDKVLLEGGSRRASSPQSSLFNSRACRIGGFNSSSNTAYGLVYDEAVGGTMGHSYVMLHKSDYNAFLAQAVIHKFDAVFLLDTYNVRKALDEVLRVVNEAGLSKFSLRIDSGDLLAQSLMIHEFMKVNGILRSQYSIIASDNLNAVKIKSLEDDGAGIDKYLVGTHLVNPPKPLAGIYKMTAFKKGDEWFPCAKKSEDLSKSTLPGIHEVYRITGADGVFRADVIALAGEDVSGYVGDNESVKSLLMPVIKGGALVYDTPSINEISRYRESQLSKFNVKDISNYPVILSEGVKYLNIKLNGGVL